MVLPARGAGCEIEPEAELGQELQLEAHDARAGMVRIEQAIEHPVQRRVDLWALVALWQHAAERGVMSDAVARIRGTCARRRPRIERLDRVVTEMFIEPCAPVTTNSVTRVQFR